MFSSRDLKSIITEVRPIVERQLDDADLIAGFRETVTAQGGDWSQVKALVKAMIQDERDEAGGHKRVLAILHKADNALGYADMLGLGNLNEKNSFDEAAADALGIAEVMRHGVNGPQPEHDADGVIIEPAEDQHGAASAPSIGMQSATVAADANIGGKHENAVRSEPSVIQDRRHQSESGALDGHAVETGELQRQPRDATNAKPAESFAEEISATHTEPVAIHAPDMATVAGDRSEALTPAAAPVVAKADFSRPNPACADPDDCGVEASWNRMCGFCLRRRDAQRHSAEAVH